MADRLPWEVVETLPSTSESLLAEWEQRVAIHVDAGADRVRALVGRALSRYWAVPLGLSDLSWQEMRDSIADDIDEAIAIAADSTDADTRATALLGRLYALWGPDQRIEEPLEELLEIRDRVADEELRLRIREWAVLEDLLRGDLGSAEDQVAEFADLAAGTDLALFSRRVELWRANLAMLHGEIDESVRLNTEAISSTADAAGSPFSFQNVAVTMSIERFLRRGLDDLVDAVRSIRASSPRVGANWDVGLAFTLSEAGYTDEAASLFDDIAADGFRRIHRDLNWAPTMNLVALVALRLDRREAIAQLLDLLEGFAELDTTHGSGYASYGPMGRVVAMLADRLGRTDEAIAHLDFVLEHFDAGPWTALSRLERARATSSIAPSAALEDATRAGRELRALGMCAWAEQAEELGLELRLDGNGAPVAVLIDDRWQLRHPEGRAEVANGAGMEKLLELLRRPGTPVSAVDLDGADAFLPRTAASDEVLDPQATRALRRRLEELEAMSSDEVPDDALREAEFIRRELAAASYGPTGSVELERARVRVTKALKRAITAVSVESPGLGRHLSGAVSTGRNCIYTPADAVAWEVFSHR